MELKQHPLSAAFPAMSAEDFHALKDDIKATGQREPIILHDGMVLDGWHRYRACVDLGIKPQQFNFGDGDPVAFVLSHNLHRRHLSASQRAAAVVACSAWAPKGRPGKAETISAFSHDKDMAKAAGTSDRTIRDAKAAHKAGLTDLVKQGSMTAHEAAQVARGAPQEATPKPTAKPKRALDNRASEPAPTSDDQLAEAQHTITELAAENEQLQDRLAVEAMDASEHEKTQAAETIRELRALVKTLEAENAALKVSRDTYQREASELKRQCAAQQRELKKLRAAA